MFAVWPACDAIKVLEDWLWAQHCSDAELRTPYGLAHGACHGIPGISTCSISFALHNLVSLNSVEGLPIVRCIGPLALLWDGRACQAGCPCSTSSDELQGLMVRPIIGFGVGWQCLPGWLSLFSKQ
jgi:hypothetical protein